MFITTCYVSLIKNTLRNIMKQKKKELAESLRQELKRLPEHNMFGGTNDTSSYDKAIEYLETGKVPSNYEDSELLVGVIDDFDVMYNDYCKS